MTTPVDISGEVQVRQAKLGRLRAAPAATTEREPEYEWEFDFAFDDWYDPRLSWCRRYAPA